MIFYELWDKKSRNLLGSYETQQEAIETAARIVAPDPKRVLWLTLDWGDDDDEDAGGIIAEGLQVGELIRSRAQAPSSPASVKQPG